MALLLVTGVWMLLLPLPYGTWMAGRLHRWLSDSKMAPLGFTITWLLGLALLTASLEVWSLFGPLQEQAFAAAAAGAVLLAILDRASFADTISEGSAQLWRLPLLAKFMLSLIGIGLLVFAANPSINGDTGVYHAQAIRWLEETGAIPGLANVETRIGYNSSWFVPEVLASWGQWLGSPLQTLNGLILFVFSAYSLSAVTEARQTLSAAPLLRLLLLPLLLFWCLDDVASLSPDPAVTMLVLVVLSQAVALTFPGRHRAITAAHAAIMVLVAFTITVKMSAAPLLLLPLLWVARTFNMQAWKWLTKLTAVVMVVVAPWLVRNVVLTGYLLFPFPSLDLFSFDWEVNRAELYLHVDYIRNFARNPALTQYNVYGKPISYWLPLWWQQQQFYDKILTLLAPLMLLFAAVIMLWQRLWRQPWMPTVLLATVVASAGTTFWFTTAPAYRFGYGFILGLFALLLLPLSWLIARYQLRAVLAILMLGAAGALFAKLLLLEFRFFATPRYIPASQFIGFLNRISDPARRAFVQQCYKAGSRQQAYTLQTYLPESEKIRLVAILVSSGNIHSQGLGALSQRLWRPASYPQNTFDTVYIGGLRFLQPAARRLPQEYGSWYAPFPFTNSAATIWPRGANLRDGFRLRQSSEH